MTEKTLFTIDNLVNAFNSVVIPTESLTENEFAQFDITPEELRQRLGEYGEATVAIKYQPKVARKLVNAANKYVDTLDRLAVELVELDNSRQAASASSVGYLLSEADEARRKIMRQYKRVGDFDAPQLSEIVAYLLIGLKAANQNTGDDNEQ